MNTKETLREDAAGEPQGQEEPEERWPAVMALLSIGGLSLALPPSLTVGPRWLPLACVIILLIPTIIAHRMGAVKANHFFGNSVAGVVTVSLLLSLGMLIRALPAHSEAPVALLKSAAALWVTNVLVFASWYWRLDAGGPHCRERTPGHDRGAFLFPQMTMDDAVEDGGGNVPWSPKFVDYLFLAFNTSTALSPADTAVLSRWAKVLLMLQASISLTIIVILAGRAVNIL